ncbi:hypothetical protein ABRP93_11330 [Corynebacterium sp. KPL2850]|uniref:hypothetical protein n=1 Tax=Corynebacterium sp. KPL2850 TaxID=3158318 RepID=UPI0032EFF3E4
MTTPADVKGVFASLAGRRVTAQDMADILKTSRNTVNLRLKNGLEAGDIIAISRGLNINPVDALVELDKLTRSEVFDFLEGDTKLLATASIEDLVYRLAEDTLSNVDKIELGGAARALLERDDLASRRVETSVSGSSDSMPFGAVAYSGPDEDAEREDADGEYD